MNLTNIENENVGWDATLGLNLNLSLLDPDVSFSPQVTSHAVSLQYEDTSHIIQACSRSWNRGLAEAYQHYNFGTTLPEKFLKVFRTAC